MPVPKPTSAQTAEALAILAASRPSTVHPAIPMLTATWQSIAAVCADLSDSQWLTMTECPGWTILDQVSHMLGSERTLLGHQLPRDPLIANHVNNDLGAFNEAWVEHYRGWQGGELLMEFARITAERLEYLGRATAGDLQAETITPLGIMSLGDLLSVRLVDCFAHEQDIRRAAGRPGHLDDSVAAEVVSLSMNYIPRQVARGAQAPNGSVVLFDIEGAAGQKCAVGVTAGRGSWLEAVPESPTVTLDMDVETFLCLGFGRWSAQRALAEARVGIDGDVELGRAVLTVMNFML